MYSRRLGAYASPAVGSYTLGCSTCPPRTLGALPLLSTATGFVSSAISGLFSSSDPIKDAQRKARIDQEYAKAMSGDQAAVNCLADMARGVANNDGRICAVGSQTAATYAKAKYLEFQARHALGQAATTIFPYALSESDLPSQGIGAVTRAISNPLVLGGIVLGAVLLMRKRR